MSAALKIASTIHSHRHSDDAAPFHETRALIEKLADESEFGRKLHETFSRERFELAKAESRVHRIAQGAMERFDAVVPRLQRDYDALRVEHERIRGQLDWAATFIGHSL